MRGLLALPMIGREAAWQFQGLEPLLPLLAGQLAAGPSTSTGAGELA